MRKIKVRVNVNASKDAGFGDWAAHVVKSRTERCLEEGPLNKPMISLVV